MQNGQTEPKLYVYTTKGLFVHSKKDINKEKPKVCSVFHHQTYELQNII